MNILATKRAKKSPFYNNLKIIINFNYNNFIIIIYFNNKNQFYYNNNNTSIVVIIFLNSYNNKYINFIFKLLLFLFIFMFANKTFL